jgi:anti-anti-sigma factor
LEREPQLELDVTADDRQPTYTVVTLDGELDVGQAPQLRTKLVDLMNEGKLRLVLDLSAVDFIDSSGLGVLIRALRRLRSQGGELRLVVTKPEVRRIFDITGLTAEFSISESFG